MMLISMTLTLEAEGRHSMSAVLNSHKGFTLIELMISLAAASIVTAGIYGFYHVQQKSAVTQQLVVEMQQNIRATMSLMKREIRMMGYDPVVADGIDNDVNGTIDDESAGSGIITAARDSIQFDWDRDGDGAIDNTGSGEGIIYSFWPAADTDSDGIADSGSAPLGRDPGPANPVAMADDIQAVGFAYAFDDDGDGLLDISLLNNNVIWAFDADADGFLDTILDTNDDGLIDTADAPGGAALAPAIDINNIRAVRIWLLGRTRSPQLWY
jgi:type IV pilus assembly protein PilW